MKSSFEMQHPNSSFDPTPFLAPRFWPTWLLIALFRGLVMLPWAWQLRLGMALGDLSRYLLPRRRRIVETNVAMAFPSLSPGQRRLLVRESMRNSGIAVFETMFSWWGDERRLRSMARTEGVEHLHRAWKAGRGVILLGGHFTCMMLCGRMLALQLPFHILVKKSRNPLFEALMHHYRRKHYQGVIDSHDLRAMVRALKENRICWYAPDQDFGRKHSVFAPFMGVSTATLTTTARLARLSGAPVLPIAYRRLPGNGGYRITIHPPLAAFPTGDAVEDATRINQIVEQQLREAPEQYLWAHRRFKTRPADEPGPYPPKRARRRSRTR